MSSAHGAARIAPLRQQISKLSGLFTISDFGPGPLTIVLPVKPQVNKVGMDVA